MTRCFFAGYAGVSSIAWGQYWPHPIQKEQVNATWRAVISWPKQFNVPFLDQANSCLRCLSYGFHTPGRVVTKQISSENLGIGVQWTTPKEEHSLSKVIVKKKSRKYFSFEDILAVSGVYSISSIGINTKMHGPLQGSSTDPPTEIMALVAKSVVKLLRPSRLLFKFDHRPTQSSEILQYKSRLFSVGAIKTSYRTIQSSPTC